MGDEAASNPDFEVRKAILGEKYCNDPSSYSESMGGLIKQC
jgi:hypothetical protein